eukprot:1145020-Pelagomonas_calceolata.AAC.4
MAGDGLVRGGSLLLAAAVVRDSQWSAEMTGHGRPLSPALLSKQVWARMSWTESCSAATCSTKKPERHKILKAVQTNLNAPASRRGTFPNGFNSLYDLVRVAPLWMGVGISFTGKALTLEEAAGYWIQSRNNKYLPAEKEACATWLAHGVKVELGFHCDGGLGLGSGLSCGKQTACQRAAWTYSN